MSDLRTRIADVLAKDDGINLGSGWDEGDLLNIADVLIRELGLRYEYENGQVLYHPKPKAASGNGNWRYRVSSDLIPYTGE